MRTILHVIDTTGPGGAETVFIDLVTRLPVDLYRSIVIVRGTGWVHSELLRRGIEPVILNAKGSFNWRYLLDLRSLIRDESVDIIQSHLLGSNVYCALAGLLTRTPVVATFHGTVDIGDNERMKYLKFAVIRAGAKEIITVSSSLRDIIAGRTAIPAKRIRVIHNGIDVDRFMSSGSGALRKRFGWTDADTIIGSIGNIRPAKGYDILLRTASALLERPGSYRFVIAGQSDSGGLYAELIQLRAELGLEENVHFIGFHEDPGEFLSEIDLFLMPSTSEGFSIATIQAMATGIPAIATRCGGPEEIIIHNETGLLVDIANPVALADAIETMSENADYAGMLAARAQEYVKKHFDIEGMIGSYQEIYENLCGQTS